VEQAMSLKRFQARAKGRGNRITKRTCHIFVTVGDEEKKKPSVSRQRNRNALMGQKIHPIGFRLSVKQELVVALVREQQELRHDAERGPEGPRVFEETAIHASVGKVVIERPAKDARITIHSARPGVVIGKKGEDIEMLKADLRKLLGVQMVHVNIEEIASPRSMRSSSRIRSRNSWKSGSCSAAP